MYQRYSSIPINALGTNDDNLQLRLGSLCINTVENSALSTDKLNSDGAPNEPMPFDFDHKPRILNEKVDIGAY